MARGAFGNYRLLSRLGGGGMGEVWLAARADPGSAETTVVLKHLRGDLAASEAARAMFRDEARLAARMRHPGVVRALEVVADGKEPYLVLEHLAGRPLARLLEERDRFAVPVLVRVLADALDALHYVHELTDERGAPLQLVHRDVSPDNVVVTYDGRVVLVDLGLAKGANTAGDPEPGAFRGRVRYAAPEQARSEELDRRADVFAAGVILWEALAGRRLWDGLPDAAVLVAVASSEIPALPARDDVPPALAAIVATATAFDREARFGSAADMRAALLAWLRASGGAVIDLAAAMRGAFERERR
jgi:serine/threonine-protein kinase